MFLLFSTIQPSNQSNSETLRGRPQNQDSRHQDTIICVLCRFIGAIMGHIHLIAAGHPKIIAFP